ncbi:guanine nucleotide-binding protein subunit beta-1 [Anaeramoeba ignava]|uniref:Guanine nucleotide-binding protein subunit beta-1 n=1 Tax=Anaeramoeba ignava TaxID=1746090 RepID=A0A9Q0LCH0_ANAIG|nr:guanine nucleotide-binding protein subunit beta-1 [Anaeramoeba ignava]
MEDIKDRITEAKARIKELKESIRQKSQELNDTTLIHAAANVKEFDPSILGVRRELKGHLAKIYAMHWSEDNTHLVSAGQDGRLFVWNAYTNNKIHVIALRSHWVMGCGYSPSGNLIASGGLDNLCTIYNVRSEDPQLKPLCELSAHTGYVSSCRFLNDNQILTSSGDMSCILWDIETSTKITEFADHNGDVMSISLQKDNNMFVSGGAEGVAKLWDIKSGNSVATFEGHQADINSVKFFPDGQAFATGSDDATCRIFDIRSGRELIQLTNDDILCGIGAVDFSLSGRILFGGYDNNHCYGWDTLKGHQVFDLKSHTEKVSCLGVSKDGFALCTGSWDRELKIWA